MHRSSSWLSTVYHSPVTVAPYLWAPRFFDYIAKALTKRRYYTPRASKTVSVFEPNLNVVKTSMIPLTIIELLHRDSPGLFERAYVTNANEMSNLPEFKSLVHNSLSVHRDGKLFFEGRFRFAWFLSAHTDVVLSHQWGCALNYLYIEALYAGYPLVHNSPYFKVRIVIR